MRADRRGHRRAGAVLQGRRNLRHELVTRGVVAGGITIGRERLTNG
jgi:hypothetical protein